MLLKKKGKGTVLSTNESLRLPEDVIDQKRRQLQLKSLWTSVIIKTALLILAVWVVFSYIFGIAVVHSNSMETSLFDGDLTFFYRLDKNYLADDIVAFHGYNTTIDYGRVIAVAGDVVSFDEEKYLYVNGHIQTMDGEKIIIEDPGTNNNYPLTIPEGSVFLLHDNLSDTSDSRLMGPVLVKNTYGKLFQLFRRRNF
ncbi:MAG: signal peptidase I [Eubacteriaceae bacterium]|jgi:signal peptidase I